MKILSLSRRSKWLEIGRGPISNEQIQKHVGHFSQIIIFTSLIFVHCKNHVSFDSRRIEIKPNRVHSIRFDPSYYYDSELNVNQFAEKYAHEWRSSGVNTVHMKVYDPIHGAVYRTKHLLNIETDYGRVNLLKAMLEACHQENIRVFAWIPAFRHKHAWEAHPEWRVKQLDGRDYQPTPESYFLCTRHPDFREWWLNFINEILETYRDIDGIDVAEPIVAWKTDAGCFCDQCQQAFEKEEKFSKEISSRIWEKIRPVPLTSLLEKTCHLIQSYEKSASITTIVTSHDDGNLYSPEEQCALTGFDLNSILDSPDKPDIIDGEFIWQQWADIFDDTVTFTPKWTTRAAEQFITQVDNRSAVIIHPELTPLGNVGVTDKQFIESMTSILDAGADGIDFYDSFQADTRGLWSEIKQAFDYVPTKKVVVFYDPDGENDALQLNTLLRHFQTDTKLYPLEDTFPYTPDPNVDVIFYMGVTQRNDLPKSFIQYISQAEKTVCWLNYNIETLGGKTLSDLGFEHKTIEENGSFEISFKNTLFPKADSTLNIIHVQEKDIECEILATAASTERDFPYVIKSNQFWYIADLPTNYVIEGGRHIVFADLLHDILQEDHQEKHLALVRIEDVNPESNPQSLRDIANFLGGRKIPFAVGLSPFYLDPSTNTALSLSEAPDLVKALRHVVSKGGIIVLHGCTHQYRGQTTVDYEFWDSFSNGPIFQDSEEYVRERIERALKECAKNRIYPLVWETPHYAASQLDYSVIDQIFSTAYGRRQTMDLHGSDQLLPYFIPGDNYTSQMIPENLGYIPTSNPSPDDMVQNARRNLAIRDGFASFFFHPFVSLDVLKKLVKDIQALGYTFADIRSLNNRVISPSRIIVSGQAEIALDVNDQYLNQFQMTPDGKEKNQIRSDEKQSAQFTTYIDCPNGWLYVAEAVDEKRPNFLSNIWTHLKKSPVQIHKLWEIKPLTSINPSIKAVVLIDPQAESDTLINQQSYFAALNSVGVDEKIISVEDFFEIPEETNLLIVPQSVANKLTEQQNLFIISSLVKGLNLILEKESHLSQRIGIIPSNEEKRVKNIQDEYYPSVDILWREEGTYRPFEVDIEYVTYYSDKNTGDPIVIGGEYGEGQYLYFTTLFDPTTSEGYGRYPYFCDLLQRQFGLWPLVRANNGEIYFEPGDREDVSIEDLVKMWKQYGFQKIYVAGWHIYPEWTYDYGRLIELAHENAMLVYLWLKIPHVNRKFWDEHPEWREKTATGEEAIINWRRNMALTEKNCREAVRSEIYSLLVQYDWDGINLAELYFESHLGPDRPDIFTPMHASVRESFESQHGLDPILLFDPQSQYFWKTNTDAWLKFENYRKETIVELHREFLDFLHRFRKEKNNDLEIIVTAIDNIHAQKTGRHTASDTDKLIALSREFPFVLQIEDPQELWHLGPHRYRNLSQTYRPKVQDNGLILDINVVSYRQQEMSQAPTRQPTGLELTRFIGEALQDSNRVALYSESSIYEVDLPWIAYALGRNAKEDLSTYRWEIHSQDKIVLQLDPEQHTDILVDGQLWPAYHKGQLILPRGNHTITSIKQIEKLKNIFKNSTRLADISGDLKSCKLISKGIELSYFSSAPNYLIVNEKPHKIIVDGRQTPFVLFHGSPGYSLKLPSGFHSVKILTSTMGSITLKNFSITVSAFIVFISSLAGVVLLTLYIRHSRRRKLINDNKNRKK